MYGSIFRALPGPVWLKVILAIALVAGILFLLFEYVYPWMNATFFDSTVS